MVYPFNMCGYLDLCMYSRGIRVSRVLLLLSLSALFAVADFARADVWVNLPEKGFEDSELELDLTVAARAWAKAWHWKQDVIYSYSVDTGWDVRRNPLNGEVVGRELTGVIVLRKSATQCRYHYARFSQKYINSRFTHTRMISLLPMQQEIDCDKI
jgi:hypothetical protein